MTGFKNVEHGIEHFLEHLGEHISDELKLALQVLKPSIDAVTQSIKDNGPAVIQKAVQAAAAAAMTAKNDGKGNSDAGHAALAALETAAAKGIVELGVDAVHAIVTAQVTASVAGAGQ